MEIDYSGLALRPLLDIAETAPKQLNEQIESALKQLIDDGYELLGDSMLDALIAHPERIPVEWHTMADVDSLETAEIRFDGSPFTSATGEICVPTLMFNKGHWDKGFSPRLLGASHIQVFEASPSAIPHIYTAVRTVSD